MLISLLTANKFYLMLSAACILTKFRIAIKKILGITKNLYIFFHIVPLGLTIPLTPPPPKKKKHLDSLAKTPVVGMKNTFTRCGQEVQDTFVTIC